MATKHINRILTLFFVTGLAVSLGLASASNTPAGPPASGGPPSETPAPANPGLGPWLSPEEKRDLRESFPPRERKYLVDVGPRLIHPRRDNPVHFDNDFANVYIQFDEPLRAQERGQLKRMSIRFEGTIGQHTYLAQVRSQALQGLQNHPRFRGVEMVDPLDKLTQPLGTGRLPGYAITEDGDIKATVRFNRNVRLSEALSLLDSHDIRALDRGRMLFNNRLQIEADPKQISALAESHLVRMISEAPPPAIDLNTNAANRVNVDVLQDEYNLDGEGVPIGMWESGHPQLDHPDLEGFVTRIQGSPTDHATHVAGTILSQGQEFPDTLGMAPNAAQIYSYTSGSDAASEQTDAVDDHGIVLSNHSWGRRVGWSRVDGEWIFVNNLEFFGQYDDRSQAHDSMVAETGLIVQKSSGNDSNDCNPDDENDCDGELASDNQRYRTISGTSNAKNVLVIGATNRNNDNITNFSSTGPTNDFRIKPDLVATGGFLISTCIEFEDEDDEDSDIIGSIQCGKGGTSMSAPVVTGAIALLVQRYRQNFEDITPSPDIIKSLLVNTAVDLGRPGPDYVYGHGMLDALAAVETIDVGAVRIVTSTVDTDDRDNWTVEVSPHKDELRLTLSWVDPEGPIGDAPVLINNLDVELHAPDGTVHYPFSGPRGEDPDDPEGWIQDATADGPNTVDNVLHARVDDPMQGIWEVRVDGTAVPEGPQNYALVSNSTFLLPDQPRIAVNAALDYDEICLDEFQDKTVSIFNTGGENLWVHEVSVAEGQEDFFVLPNPSQPFVVAPGAHVDLTVRFAPDSAGLAEGILKIHSNDVEDGLLEIEMTGSGGEPEIGTTFNSDFGEICLDGSVTRELRITNSGSCPLNVSDINSDSLEFAVAAVMDFPISVASGGEVTVPIEFTPSERGERTANLQILSDDAENDNINIGMTGTGDVPEIATTLDSDFGDVCLEDSRTHELMITNPGNCPLSISNISSSNDEFSIAQILDFPVSVAAGGEITIPIEFDPSGDFGPRDGTISVYHDGETEGSPVELPVQGNAPTGSLNTALANQGDFGAVCKDDHADLNLSLINEGQCNLTVGSIAIDPPTSSFELPVDTTYPLTLGPGSDFNVPVRYAPEICDDDSEQAQVVIESDDPEKSEFAIDLTGTSPCPNLEIDPAGLEDLFSFPATVVDSDGSLRCYSDATVSLRNSGGCPLTISSIAAEELDFSVTTPSQFPIVLPTGEETLEVNIRFTPQSDDDPLIPNEVLGSLTIVSDDPDENAGEAELCGESVAQSGARILVTDVTSGSPVILDSVERIDLTSKGINQPGPIRLRFNDAEVQQAQVCGNTIDYHVNQEDLPSTETTGGGGSKSSYEAKAKDGNLQIAQSFTLDQCEFRDFQLQLSSSDDPEPDPEPGNGQMSVYSIELDIRARGPWRSGEATVTIVDEDDNPVSGATVSGYFTGDVDGSDSDSTNSDGIAALESNRDRADSIEYEFCVESVSHSDFEDIDSEVCASLP